MTTTIPKGSLSVLWVSLGSGKSTLFKLLIGLQECPEKSIYFGNQDLTNIPLTNLGTPLPMYQLNLTY